MNIRAKLILGFGAAVVSSGLGGYMSIQKGQEIAQYLEKDITVATTELKRASYLDGLAQSIRYYDEVLTQSARNYAFTGDKKWAERYREHEPRLDQAAKHAIENGGNLDRLFFSQVDEVSLALVAMEHRSISLVARGRSSEAIRILESKKYRNQKQIYGSSLVDYVERKGLLDSASHTSTVKAVLAVTELAKRSAQSRVRSIWVLTAVLFALAILAIIIVDRTITRPLNRLKEVALEIGEGDFSVCTEIRSNDEVGSLASSIEQMAIDLGNTTTSLESLNNESAVRRCVEDDQALLVHDMSMRIKELRCMYGVADVLRSRNTLEEIFNDLVKLLPSGLHYSHIARAKIRFDGVEYVSEPFQETEWVLTSEIVVGGQPHGSIELYYLEEASELDEGPFQKEECRLIEGISRMMGKVVELWLAEKAKDWLKAQLLQSDKLALVGQLSGGVAHEINNPMGYISSNLGTMRKYLARIKCYFESNGAQVSDEQREIIEIVADFGNAVSESLAGADQVKKIVVDLNGFTRGRSDRMEPTDLNTALESALNVVWNQFKHTCKVEKDLGDLPAVQCYRSQIGQVLLNLLVNAGQAISDGSGTIKIRTWADDKRCYISVKDDGCGIAQKYLDKIFDPFFTTKDIDKGAGLGLSVSSEIVKAHGGRIDVDSVVGQGTVFIVSLPLVQSRMTVERELAGAPKG